MACSHVGRGAVVGAPESEFLIRSWQMEDGLPDSSVKAIVQTHDGYLWVGTDNGLARFDGVQFKVFDSRTTPQLGSSRILSLLEDHAGALWIGTAQGGVTRFVNGHFQRMNIGEQNGASIPALLEDGEGRVWAALEGRGFACFDAGRFRTFSATNGPVIGEASRRTSVLPTDSDVPITATIFGLKAIANDSEGHIWASSEQRDYLYTLRNGAWHAVFKESGITALCARNGGGLWIAGGGRLRERLPDGSTRDHVPYPWGEGLAPVPVTVMHQDRTGALWVGTLANGLFRFSTNGVWSRVAGEGPLFQNVIFSIAEDREGAIWVGTDNGGLHRLKPRLVSVLPMPSIARDAPAWCVCAARDRSMWIGTGGAGVFRYRKGEEQLAHFGEAEGLASPYVNTMLEDNRTNLWIGSRGGLFVYESGRFHKFSGLGPLPGWVMSLFEDHEGRLWVGAYGGVACWDGSNVKWFMPKDGLSNPDVRAITEDDRGNIWIGTAGGGLDCIKNGRMIHYGKAEGLSSSMIVALLPDRNGTLWIGTYKGGLIRMKDGRFTTFTTADGLTCDIAGHLAEDTHGNLWITSVRGLMRVSKAALNAYKPDQANPLPCLTLTVNDGMFSQLCSGCTQPALAWDADGRLWVPNMKAVALVTPATLKPDASARVALEEVLVNGIVHSLPAGHPLRLPVGKDRFELHYAALNLATAEAMRFRYKLEGWDNDWQDAGNRRVAYYSALPAGNYRFRVMAAGPDGVWNKNPVPLVLQIVPRFWQTVWFHISSAVALVLSVAAGVFLVVRWKARREMDRVQRAHNLERERARIAQDIHDELGAGLAQIGLLADIGEQNSNETGRSLASIAQRARTTVTALDEIVWAVNPSNDNLTRLADYLCRQAEECFERGATRCYKSVPTNLPAVPVRAEVRHNLIMAVREALTNTLKHARASEVWLRLTWTNPDLVVVVEDNGRGFDSGAVWDRGNGLANQRARLNKLGGSMELVSRPGHGTRTTFRVRLVYGKE